MMRCPPTHQWLCHSKSCSKAKFLENWKTGKPTENRMEMNRMGIASKHYDLHRTMLGNQSLTPEKSKHGSGLKSIYNLQLFYGRKQQNDKAKKKQTKNALILTIQLFSKRNFSIRRKNDKLWRRVMMRQAHGKQKSQSTWAFANEVMNSYC